MGRLRRAALYVWRFICAAAAYIFIVIYLYKIKSDLHRLIYDRRWKDKVIPSFDSLSDLNVYMDRFIWVRDSWSELFDAICTPQKVQATLEAHDPSVAGSAHGNDCDEMGIWQLAALEKSPRLLSSSGIKNAYLFTVMWLETDTFLPQGHNLTLVEFNDGQFGAIDYGWMQAVSLSVDEVANQIRLKYAGWSTTGYGRSPSVPLMWATHDIKLKPVKVRFQGS